MSNEDDVSPRWIFNQKDAAQVIGKPAYWLRDNTAPQIDRDPAEKSKESFYDIRRLVQWTIAKLSPDEVETKKKEQDLRYATARAEKMEAENKVRSGELVAVVEVREMLEAVAKKIRDVGDLMGRKSSIAGKDAQRLLNDALAEYERQANENY